MRQCQAEGGFEGPRTFRLPRSPGRQAQGGNLRRFERAGDRGLYTERVTRTGLLVGEECCDMTRQGRILW
jgi:hypothetical protein